MADSSRPWTVPAAVVSRLALGHWTPLLAPAARRALAFGAAALAASWLGFYLITPLPFLAPETFRATISLHLVTGIIFLPYLLSLVATRRLPGGSVLDAPLVALLGVSLLTTATSLDWRVSLEPALTALMALGVFYVLSDRRLLRRWQVELALMLAVLAAALKALWVVGGDYLDWLQLARAVEGGFLRRDLLPPTVPMVHDVGDTPSLLGAALAMGVPFFLVAILRPDRAALRVLPALAAAAVLLATFLTLSRPAWLGAATGGLTTATLLLVGTPGGRDLLRRLWPSRLLRRSLVGALALAVLAVAAAGATYFVQSVEARPLWLVPSSTAPRSDAMQAGAEMAGDYLWLGTGPGVYPLLYPSYSGRYPTQAFHSHNGFLQTAIDMGVPGVLATLVLAGALGWLLVRGLRATEGAARLSLVACAGSLIAFATFSLFDAPNGSKGPLVTLAAVGAVAVLSRHEGGAPAGPPAGRRARWAQLFQVVQVPARIAVPVAMAGLLIAWGRLDIGHYYYSNGLSNANAQRWPQAFEQTQRAVELDPQLAIYRLQLGASQGQAYLATGDLALRDDAVGQLERGLALEPGSAIGHANLALLLARARDRKGTREEAQAALRFANGDPEVALAVGTALEATNWGDEAVDAYAQALSLDRRLADSAFWAGSPFRRTSFPEIVARSALAFDPCALLRLAEAGLSAGPLSRAQALAACRRRVEADPGDASGRVALAEALIQDGALTEAFAYLDHALARQPDNGPARTALGRWYEAQGEPDEARRAWLRAGQLRQLEALVLLGDSYLPSQVPPEIVQALRSLLAEAGSDVRPHPVGDLYYQRSFYREAPETILLPGEWQQAVRDRYGWAREALARWTGADG